MFLNLMYSHWLKYMKFQNVSYSSAYGIGKTWTCWINMEGGPTLQGEDNNQQ